MVPLAWRSEETRPLQNQVTLAEEQLLTYSEAGNQERVFKWKENSKEQNRRKQTRANSMLTGQREVRARMLADRGGSAAEQHHVNPTSLQHPEHTTGSGWRKGHRSGVTSLQQKRHGNDKATNVPC